MVKCPKCGVKGCDNYNPIVTLDTDYLDDKLILINKVECFECGHHYNVKEIYKLTLTNCSNVD